MTIRCSRICHTKIGFVLRCMPLWIVVCCLLCGCRATTPPFLTDEHGPIASVVVTDILDAEQGYVGELSATEIGALSSLLEASSGRWERGNLFLARDYQLDILWNDGHREMLLIGLGAIISIDLGFAQISDSEADSIFVHLRASIERGKQARLAASENTPASKNE